MGCKEQKVKEKCILPTIGIICKNVYLNVKHLTNCAVDNIARLEELILRYELKRELTIVFGRFNNV